MLWMLKMINISFLTAHKSIVGAIIMMMDACVSAVEKNWPNSEPYFILNAWKSHRKDVYDAF